MSPHRRCPAGGLPVHAGRRDRNRHAPDPRRAGVTLCRDLAVEGTGDSLRLRRVPAAMPTPSQSGRIKLQTPQWLTEIRPHRATLQRACCRVRAGGGTEIGTQMSGADARPPGGRAPLKFGGMTPTIVNGLKLSWMVRPNTSLSRPELPLPIRHRSPPQPAFRAAEDLPMGCERAPERRGRLQHAKIVPRWRGRH